VVDVVKVDPEESGSCSSRMMWRLFQQKYLEFIPEEESGG
jgi:hypothetical protein